MFYVIHAKKLRQFLCVTLLFCLLTAIILKRTDEQRVEAVSAAPSAGHILVIDAGHGGLDGGAVAADGMTESGVNLAIARKLEFIANFCGVKTVMTRTEDDLDYPEDADTVKAKKTWDQKRRAEIIRATPNAILISIHQNKYPDPRPNGSQVLYATSEGSRELGELTHSLLITSLAPENRRVAAPISETIYLLKNLNCPGILVECGFLSNPAEAALLADDGYRCKLALVLAAAYLNYTSCAA